MANPFSSAEGKKKKEKTPEEEEKKIFKKIGWAIFGIFGGILIIIALLYTIVYLVFGDIFS